MLRTIHRNLKKSRGFTLVELMIVVAIVGILAALAIYGVRKYMTNAKTAEAKNSLGQLAKDASTAFDREKMDGTLLPAGNSTAVSNLLCASAGATVPASKDSIKGKKYQSNPTEWDVGTDKTGWKCLKFTMGAPQYFMYGYAETGTAGDGDKFFATAEGDLDGDGTTSKFEIQAEVRSGSVALSPSVLETNPEE
jgi:type IV pilus assembly protein PilA